MNLTKTIPNSKKNFLSLQNIHKSQSETYKRPNFIYITKLKGFEILEDIKVQIKIEEKEFLAEIPELNIYAYDKDIHECMKEIKEDIIRLHHDLNRERKETLGLKPKQWKEFLNYSIKKV